MKSLKKYRSAENRSLLCMCWSVDKRSLMHWGGPMRGSNGRASCSARMHGNGFEVWMRCEVREDTSATENVGATRSIKDALDEDSSTARTEALNIDDAPLSALLDTLDN